MNCNDRLNDRLYATKLAQVGEFRFDASVAQVFADMISRSVPGYELILASLPLLAARYAQSDSSLYDLGCSLGAVSLALRAGVKQQNCQIIAVDNSADMVASCRFNVQQDTNPTPVSVIEANIQDIILQPASIVVLNFTLQFIPAPQRMDLINKIYQALLPQGILVLSEKLVFNEDFVNSKLIELHHDFKRAQGYTELEISQKRAALDKVLIPETLEIHQQRLQQAGFKYHSVWLQCLNFVSVLAWKA